MLRTDDILRKSITVKGCVQGVGFRPFVFCLAHKMSLSGSVSNTTDGVKIEVQGTSSSIHSFLLALDLEKPQKATIDQLEVFDLDVKEESSFCIADSRVGSEKSLALLPDTAICSICLKELYDPNNRRYQYPFIHCMSCGPRFSLFESMPFDRKNTSMKDFQMCSCCQKEYDDSSNRRFFSQTICCANCGPKLSLIDKSSKVIAEDIDAIDKCADLLKMDKIIAMKNTGGFLLLADASNEKTLYHLRKVKKRKDKPFALLIPSFEYLNEIAEFCKASEEILHSPQAPIVLVKKKNNKLISLSVAFSSPYLGVMLPHNALQHMLLDRFKAPLVATSGNISSNPICIDDQDAIRSLSGICDFFLTHTRRIVHRVDDSIVQIIDQKPLLLRRARGYVPSVLRTKASLSSNWVFAAGSHMKNTFALGKDNQIFLSQHIGDLDTKKTCDYYEKEAQSWRDLMGVERFDAVCDSHPDYYSTRLIKNSVSNLKIVQHHRAHVYSGMLENNLSSPLLSLCWDGTGLGDDNTIWGGEAFISNEQGLERFASLNPFPCLGADTTVRKPKKTALALLLHIFDYKLETRWMSWAEKHFSQNEIHLTTEALRKKINTFYCSSMGRLFDAIASLLDLCHEITFDAQGPLMLEGLAMDGKRSSIEYKIGLIKDEILLLDYRDMILSIMRDISLGARREDIAFSFHKALADAIIALAKESNIKDVLLTGGVMQNRLLVEEAIRGLKLHGFTPHLQRSIPPSDAGLAVGQLYGHYLQTNKEVGDVSCSSRQSSTNRS